MIKKINKRNRNKFQIGGEENINDKKELELEARNFLRKWYSHPTTQLMLDEIDSRNYKYYPEIAPSGKIITDSDTARKIKVAKAGQTPINYVELNDDTLGKHIDRSYDPKLNEILINKDLWHSAILSTLIHEGEHAIQSEMPYVIKTTKPVRHKLNKGVLKDKYLDDIKEIRSRIMEARHYLNLNPDKRDYTPKEAQEIQKQLINADLDAGTSFQLERLTPETMADYLNYLAYMNNNNEKPIPQAKLGTKKTKRIIAPNIIRGGAAIPLGDNIYLLKGKKHSQGGIDIGKDLEAEGDEVVKMNPKSIKVVTAQKIMGGKSPAELVVNASSTGEQDKVFNDVFKYQERFKDRNGLNDDGTKKAKYGKKKALIGTEFKFPKVYLRQEHVFDELNDIVANAKSDKELSKNLEEFWNNIKDNVSLSSDTLQGIEQDINHYKKYPYSSIVLTRDNLDRLQKYGNDEKLVIPADYEKLITLSNAGKSNNLTTTKNLLDTLAYRGGRAQADTVRMLGIPAQETTLGKFQGTTWISDPKAITQDDSWYDHINEHREYFLRNGEVLPSELVNNHNIFASSADQDMIGAISRRFNVGHDTSNGNVLAEIDYNEVNDEIEKAFKEGFRYATNKRKNESNKEHPIEHAYKLDKTGNYNRGIGDHNDKVQQRGEELWNSPEIQQWWKESGKYFYEKGKSETKKLGGMKQFKNRKKAELGINEIISIGAGATKGVTAGLSSITDLISLGASSKQNKKYAYNAREDLRKYLDTEYNAQADFLNNKTSKLNSLLDKFKQDDLADLEKHKIIRKDAVYNPVKLNTKINISDILQEINRTKDENIRSIVENSGSSKDVLNRIRQENLKASDRVVSVQGQKEREEKILQNKDILQRKDTYDKQVDANLRINELRAQDQKDYYNKLHDIKSNYNKNYYSNLSKYMEDANTLATNWRKGQYDADRAYVDALYQNKQNNIQGWNIALNNFYEGINDSIDTAGRTYAMLNSYNNFNKKLGGSAGVRYGGKFKIKRRK